VYLKSLELAGFKSFGKKSVLQFTTPISSIVGPNGSGKSNIAEAFRFVLGEQSIKSMRGKKTEDLIFNGANTTARSNRASVKLTFDNHSRFLNIDFDEVTLERVIYRDSLSEYYINGTQVRLKDIVELLSGAHVGASGHHIISQGEADRILNANPRERRDMIEDTLGLKIYKYKKEESEKKLTKTEENLMQVESLRREVAPHLKFLKKQVEKIEKMRVLKEELKRLYQEYLKREQIYLSFHKKKIEAEMSLPQTELVRLADELEKARAVLALNKAGDQKSAEALSLESELGKVRQEKDECVRSVGRIEGEISSLERMIKRQQEVSFADAGKQIPFKEVESLAFSVDAELERIEKSEDFNMVKEVLLRVRRSVGEFLIRHKDTRNTQVILGAEEDMKRLADTRQEIEKTVLEIQEKEKEVSLRYQAMRQEIEKEKDSNRDAEKAMFRIVALQNEWRSKLSILKAREDSLRLSEDDWKREQTEGVVLVGRDVLNFETFVVCNAEQLPLGDEAVALEVRHIQEDRRRMIEKIQIRLEEGGGLGSEDVMKEYQDVTERDVFLTKEVDDLEKSAASLRVLIADLAVRIDAEFKTGIEKINKQFSDFFALMFGGGTAKLVLVREEKRKRRISSEDGGEISAMIESEPEPEAEEGLDVDVSLPRKKIKGLTMLSGGERALTSIALIFAVSQVNPPPFVILDETDAALDEANSRRYGDMIENLSKLSQLIVITHNRETMSRAGVLYGVTMGGDGVSKLLSIQFDEAVVVAK
jgi:chromosome segregation protein